MGLIRRLRDLDRRMVARGSTADTARYSAGAGALAARVNDLERRVEEFERKAIQAAG